MTNTDFDNKFFMTRAHYHVMSDIISATMAKKLTTELRRAGFCDFDRDGGNTIVRGVLGHLFEQGEWSVIFETLSKHPRVYKRLKDANLMLHIMGY